MANPIPLKNIKKPAMRRSVKILWRVFLIGFTFVLLILLMANFGIFGKMPSLQELENPEADLASEIISADGVLMGKYYSENRSEVSYSDISPNAIQALIATEDERFYDHSGIDAQALGRAIFTGGTKGGGSTITQQLAKMILHQGHGNILTRSIDKIREWIIAVKLERNFTKEEIIALYLNRAPWVNVYGIRNASRTYFQKEPKDLKLEEAAMIIGMLKGSSIYEPIRHPKQSLDRRNIVIGQMVAAKEHYLTEAEAEIYKAKPLITNYRQIDENVGIAPYYRRALIEVMKDWCAKNRNPKTGEPYNLFTDGLKIYTTIDSRMQKYAEESMQAHMPNVQSRLNSYLKLRGEKLWKNHQNIVLDAVKYTDRWKHMKEDDIDEKTIMKTFSVPVRMKIFSWKGNEKHEMDTIMSPFDSIKYHKQLMQTSFVAMDPRSGEIKAWVGGIDFKWFKFDHVTAKRQVGSTFKPLLYTLAVTDAGYTPETYIPGGPLTLNGKTISTGGGTCAYCLAKSINGCAWHLMSVIGAKRTVEFAHQVGIKVNIPAYPSIALGAAEIPMLEMLQSYTMFPNKGYNTEPVFVTRIEDKNGNLIYEFPIAQSKQVIGESDAYTMVKMMEGVIKAGTARRLNNYDIPAEKAGKTGTTDNYTDGWFIGYTPTLLAGTWVGCEDPFIPIYTSGGGAEVAAPAWGNFMTKVYADKRFENYTTQKTFVAPAELKNAPIFADAAFQNTLERGDSLIEDNGNGNADDFLKDEYYEEKPLTDTNKKEQKKEDKKIIVPPPAIIEEKKNLTKPKPKPAGNDY